MPRPEFAWLKRVHWRAVRARAFACPFCGPTLLLRLWDHEHAIRCVRCRASAVHLSLGMALRALRPELRGLRVLELSSRGALVRFLRRSGAQLQCSEYMDDVTPGTLHQGVRCEDVQRLSLPDASVDLVTHTEVFEHVEDDGAGFRELRRVLSPRGATVFSVPIDPATTTRERVLRRDSELHYVVPAEYHDDRLRGPGRVLAWRDYGGDIVERLRTAGFARAWIAPPPQGLYGRGRAIVIATCDRE
jgi:SAM-dependent methyltransferase